jgi:hypothetical protein
MFRRSGVETALRILMEGYETLYIYSDPAYSGAFGIACLWKDPQGWRYLSQDKQRFNQALSSVQIAVEQSFGKTHSL